MRDEERGLELGWSWTPGNRAKRKELAKADPASLFIDRNLQLLVEYFHGNSPDGQFFKRRVEYLGLGAHFHF